MSASSRSGTSTMDQVWFSKLHQVLSDLRQPDQAQQFLRDFLSPTEHATLAKRLAIAILLQQGVSYQDISTKLGVSSATISAVSEILNTEGMQLAIKLIHTDNRVERWLQQWLG